MYHTPLSHSASYYQPLHISFTLSLTLYHFLPSLSAYLSTFFSFLHSFLAFSFFLFNFSLIQASIFFIPIHTWSKHKCLDVLSLFSFLGSVSVSFLHFSLSWHTHTHTQQPMLSRYHFCLHPKFLSLSRFRKKESKLLLSSISSFHFIFCRKQNV